MMTVLAVVVPVVFVAGLLARQPVPAVDELPGTVRPAVPEGFTEAAVDDAAWGGLALRTTWMVGPATAEGGPPARGVTLTFLVDPRLPDLLVYWAAESEGASLALDAHLLGTIGDLQERSWVLPGDASDGGVLVLYSLARQEVVATAAVPPLNGRSS